LSKNAYSDRENCQSFRAEGQTGNREIAVNHLRIFFPLQGPSVNTPIFLTFRVYRGE